MNQLMISFEGLTAPPDVLAAVRSGQIGAIFLFAFKNIASPTQLYELTRELYRAAEEGEQLPPILGIDQEGGQLIAVTGGATELPGNMALGATRSPELAYQAGRVLAREVLAMGANMNFAPSLDVNTNPANPVVGIRSFGESPELVAELGVAMIRGMREQKVIPTAKHFPGHGDTQVDSHHTAPIVAHDRTRVEAIELYPFRQAIAAQVEAIMSAHVVFPIYDNANPATISRAIMTDLLREQMGYRGLIVTDAMDMHAVAQFGHAASVRAALDAGADLAVLGHIPDQLKLIEELNYTYRPEALRQIEKLRHAIPLQRPPLHVVGCAEHHAIAQAIADASITAVRDTQLPLHPSAKSMIAVITPRPLNLTPADTSAQTKILLAEAIRHRHSLVQSIEVPYTQLNGNIGSILQAVEHAEYVIMGTISADNDPAQADLVKALVAAGKKPIVVALRTPYDLLAFPMVDTYLCTYSIREVSMEAVARVLFGEIQAQGQLPCQIPGVVAYH